MTDKLHYLVEGVLIPVITVFGLTGNLTTIYVLCSPSVDIKVTFRHIITMLAMFDSLFILMATLTFSMPLLWPTWKLWIHPLLLPYFLPAIQISLNGSIWCTVMVAMERYFSVVHYRNK